MAFVIIGICVIVGVISFLNLKSELAPMEDRSNIRFTVTAPEGTSYNYMQKVSDRITNYLYDSVPERDLVFTRTPGGGGGGGGGGSNRAAPRIDLVELKE